MDPVTISIKLGATIGALAAAAFGIVRLRERFTRDAERQAIDALIAEKGAKPLDGMEAADWGRINRLGDRRWQTVLRGQRRQRSADVREFKRVG